MNRLKITIFNSKKSFHYRIFSDFQYVILRNPSNLCSEFRFYTISFQVEHKSRKTKFRAQIDLPLGKDLPLGGQIRFLQAGKPPTTDLQLSERLASLGIMGAQLSAPLKPPIHHSTIILRELRGYLTWAPKEMEIKFSQCTVCAWSHREFFMTVMIL